MIHMLCVNAAELRKAPCKLTMAEDLASVCNATNRGTANADKIPRMVMTTTNSISVNPRALFTDADK
jgi:hypothetical protein